MSETTSGENRMPKVDFEKDKVHDYIKDQVKVVEKENLKRLFLWKYRLIGGRRGFAFLASLVFGIYGYTMYAVNQETFLDNFDEPEMDDDL